MFSDNSWRENNSFNVVLGQSIDSSAGWRNIMFLLKGLWQICGCAIRSKKNCFWLPCFHSPGAVLSAAMLFLHRCVSRMRWIGSVWLFAWKNGGRSQSDLSQRFLGVGWVCTGTGDMMIKACGGAHFHFIILFAAYSVTRAFLGICVPEMRSIFPERLSSTEGYSKRQHKRM